MVLENIGIVIATTLLPVSELRGSIPLGIALGLNPILVLTLALLFNLLIFFPVYFLTGFLYSKLFFKVKFFKKYLTKLRVRAKPYLSRYGFFGLIVFVAIPLPTTGVYTASLIAWLFGLEWKRAFLAICIGAFIAGVITLILSLGILKVFF